MPSDTSRLRIIIDASTEAGKAELRQMTADLKGAGAATTELAATQNRLALAISEARGAAARLADAQNALAANTDPGKQQQLEQAVLRAQVALDQESTEVDQLTRELDQLSDEQNEAVRGQSALAREGQNVIGSLTEISSAINIAQQAWQGTQTVYREVVEETIELAKQTRDLARTIGATPEEASKLIQVADDVKIGYDTLTSAFEAGIRKGVEPTVEGLAEISEQFLALPPGIERSAFAMEKFGRSGNDLQPLLELGPDRLREMGDEAERLGIVLDQDMVDRAREAEIAIDNLEDSILAIKIALSIGAIPAVAEFGNAWADKIQLLTQSTRAFQEGDISAGKFAYTLFRSLTPAGLDASDELEDLNNTLREQTRATDAASDRWSGLAAEYTAAAEADAKLEAAAARTTMRLQAQAQYTRALAGHTYELASAADDATAAQARFSELLSAGTSGQITDAWASWRDVIAETSPEIEKLTAELQRYEAANGRTFTVTQEATVSLAEYELAQIKAATAAQKLAEYTGDSREEQLQLQVSAENAAERVAKMGEQMGITREFTADYTKKIAETAGSLDALIAKQEGAAEAVRNATRELIFQQATAGLSEEAALKLAFQMGMIEEQDYKTALAVQNVRDRFDENGDSMIDAAEAAKGYTTDVGLLDKAAQTLIGQLASGKITQEQYNKLLGELATAAGTSRDAIQQLIDKILGIPTERTTTITTRFVTEGNPNPAAGEGTGAGWEPVTTVPAGPDEVYGNQRAQGGSVAGGHAYIWNEPGREGEVLVPAGNGYVLDREDAMAALSGTAGGAAGPIVGEMHIHAAPGMDEHALADAVERKLAGLLRQARTSRSYYLGT